MFVIIVSLSARGFPNATLSFTCVWCVCGVYVCGVCMCVVCMCVVCMCGVYVWCV